MKKQTYIGIKQIIAVAMTHINFLQLTDPQHDEYTTLGMEDKEGYLVEYLDSPSNDFKHLGYDNYISWSPKDVFERAYKATDITPKILFKTLDRFDNIQKDENGNPTVTEEQILNLVEKEHFHIVPDTTLTICTLVLKNGFTVSGESASASIAKFEKKIGEKYAKENAVEKIWLLEGYLLRQMLNDLEVTK